MREQNSPRPQTSAVWVTHLKPLERLSGLKSAFLLSFVTWDQKALGLVQPHPQKPGQLLMSQRRRQS